MFLIDYNILLNQYSKIKPKLLYTQIIFRCSQIFFDTKEKLKQKLENNFWRIIYYIFMVQKK